MSWTSDIVYMKGIRSISQDKSMKNLNSGRFPWEPEFLCYDTCHCGHVFVVHDTNGDGRCVESSCGQCSCKKFRFKCHEIMGKYKL